MAAAVRKNPGRSRVLRQTAGLVLLGLGVLTVGYSVWAFTESRAYLDEVATSGQMVEAFDAANYLMTSSGLFLLVGVLLTALSGLYLTRPTSSLDKDSRRITRTVQPVQPLPRPHSHQGTPDRHRRQPKRRNSTRTNSTSYSAVSPKSLNLPSQETASSAAGPSEVNPRVPF